MSEIAKNIAAGLAFAGMIALIAWSMNWLLDHYPQIMIAACVIPFSLWLAYRIGREVREIWRAGK